MGNTSNIDAELARCVGSTSALDAYQAYRAYTAAQLAADMLAAEFAPPSLDAFQSHQWVLEAAAYLCTRDTHAAHLTIQ